MQSLTLRDLVLDGEHAASCPRLDASLGVIVTNVRSVSTDTHGWGIVVCLSASLTGPLHALPYAYFGLLADAVAGSSHELLISDGIFEEFSWGEAAQLPRTVWYTHSCPANSSGGPSAGLSQASCYPLTQANRVTTTFEGSWGSLSFCNSFGAKLWEFAPSLYFIALAHGCASAVRGFGDSHVYNSVICRSRVGVVDPGGSHLFQGLHVYSTCSSAPGTRNVTAGIVAGGTETRITNAQLDDSPIVITAVRQFLLTDSLMFDRAGVIIAPQEASPWDPGQIFVTHNVLAAHYFTPYVAYDTASGTLAPGSWRAFVVAENGFDNPGPQSARSIRSEPDHRAKLLDASVHASEWWWRRLLCCCTRDCGCTSATVAATSGSASTA